MSLALRVPSKVAVVIAHPDDEVLGCGGTIAKLSEMGHDVRVVLALQRDDPRGRAEWDTLVASLQESCVLLGASCLLLEPLMSERLAEPEVHALHDKILPHIEWADVILTHFNRDVNQVHRGVSRAVEIATRPFRRQKVVLLFEVASSTEQGFSQNFSPNLHVVLEEKHVARKCRAMRLYTSEQAAGRNEKAIRAKLLTRGAEIGAEFAESFVLARGFL